MLYEIISSLLKKADPEFSHHLAIQFLKKNFLPLHIFVSKPSKILETSLFGKIFRSPVGIAAGFDKNAEVYNSIFKLGFGFAEVGTITPIAQPGNPKPRVFRLTEDKAIINRLGFPSVGMDEVYTRIHQNKPNGILGINIGPNKESTSKLDDYLKCFEKFCKLSDYICINISSPNTPNLRELQEKEPLTALLTRLQALNDAKGSPKPIFLKIAPDLTEGQVDDIVEIVISSKIAGVVATNTTVSRAALNSEAAIVAAIGAGGLSGKPAFEPSTRLQQQLHDKSAGRFPIIGVGGVMTPQQAQAKFEAGASLVQLYTGFVYAGPSLVKAVAKVGRSWAAKTS